MLEAGNIQYKPGALWHRPIGFILLSKEKVAMAHNPGSVLIQHRNICQIIGGLQTIVSRQSELTKAPVVITVGKINGGVRSNIIPEECV